MTGRLAVTRYVPLLVLAGLAAGFAPAPPPRPDDPKQEHKRLLGKWAVVRQERAGKPTTTNSTDAVFAGDKLTFSNNGVKRSELTVTVGPKKAMDLKRDTNTFLCVYAVQGDTLKIAYRLAQGATNKRPASVMSKDPDVYLLILKRERK
jgi:uncharacterized protein (TIGR03067 family)